MHRAQPFMDHAVIFVEYTNSAIFAPGSNDREDRYDATTARRSSAV